MEKITKTPLKEQVYEMIKNHLISENFKEGSPIPSENSLSKSLSVSRVVVRDALKKLRNENFIVTYKGKGSFMANPENFKVKTLKLDYKNFKEIMEFRFLIECEAIKKAVELNSSELKTLLSLANAMKTAKNQREFDECDYKFHLHIVKCSGSDVLLSAIENIKDKIMACFDVMNSLPNSRDWAIPLHEELAEYVVKGDVKSAVNLLKNNSEYNFARIENIRRILYENN